MSVCVSGGSQAATSSTSTGRTLRWVFRRGSDAVICELGLNRDDSAYELRIDAPLPTVERFDDVTAAFQRHLSLERALVSDGWSLDSFEATAPLSA